MTKKVCEHVELRRAKTGGWFCIGTDCDFTIPEAPVEPKAPTDGKCGDEVRIRCVKESGHDGHHESQAGLLWPIHSPVSR